MVHVNLKSDHCIDNAKALPHTTICNTSQPCVMSTSSNNMGQSNKSDNNIMDILCCYPKLRRKKKHQKSKKEKLKKENSTKNISEMESTLQHNNKKKELITNHTTTPCACNEKPRVHSIGYVQKIVNTYEKTVNKLEKSDVFNTTSNNNITDSAQETITSKEKVQENQQSDKLCDNTSTSTKKSSNDIIHCLRLHETLIKEINKLNKNELQYGKSSSSGSDSTNEHINLPTKPQPVKDVHTLHKPRQIINKNRFYIRHNVNNCYAEKPIITTEKQHIDQESCDVSLLDDSKSYSSSKYKSFSEQSHIKSENDWKKSELSPTSSISHRDSDDRENKISLDESVVEHLEKGKPVDVKKIKRTEAPIIIHCPYSLNRQNDRHRYQTYPRKSKSKNCQIHEEKECNDILFVEENETKINPTKGLTFTQSESTHSQPPVFYYCTDTKRWVLKCADGKYEIPYTFFYNSISPPLLVRTDTVYAVGYFPHDLNDSNIHNCLFRSTRDYQGIPTLIKERMEKFPRKKKVTDDADNESDDKPEEVLDNSNFGFEHDKFTSKLNVLPR